MGFDFMWLDVWVPVVSIIWLEYKPLHLKFHRYTHTHNCTIILHFCSILHWLSHWGMRCMEHTGGDEKCI
jgi:hypothetical protein